MLPPPTSFLNLTEPEVGLDAGGVAIHHQADGAGRCEHRCLAVAHAVLLAVAHGDFPRVLAGRHDLGRHGVAALDLVAGVAVHAQHVEHVALVVGEAGERTHAAGGAGAGGVGVTGHQRRERRCPGATLDRVVGKAERHQQRAEVGVADAQLAELAAGLGDLLGRVVGAADQDLLRREDDLDRVHVAIDVEVAVLVEVVQQVDRRQVARRVVEVHVLAARVGAVDAAGGVSGVPLVDRGVELQARGRRTPTTPWPSRATGRGHGRVRTTEPSFTAYRFHSVSSMTACMNSSLTRTELLAFWYWMLKLSDPSRSMSKPASRSTRALRSSLALHHTNSSMSG